MADTTAIRMRDGSATLFRARPRLRAALISLVCLLLGAGVFVVGLGWELEVRGGDLPLPLALLVPLDLLVGIAASIAVGPIRSSRAGNLVIVVASVVSMWALPAFVVGAVRLGSRRSFALDGLVVVVFAAGAVGYTWLRDAVVGRAAQDLLLIGALATAAVVIMLLWGRVRGTRAALVVALRERANSAELAHRSALAVRDAEIAATRAEERSAIARDMHDGISHQLAIVAMHAGALEYRTDLSAEQQRTAAGTVRDAAADASGMLREALTALRDRDDVRPTIPLPDAAALDALLEAARRAGHAVALDYVGMTEADLGRTPGRATTCVRILEELVMNARKYAPGAPISIVIAMEQAHGALVLRVSNPVTDAAGPGVGTGLGLVGVTERAQLLGGTADYGATDRGTFEVRVMLP